VSFKSKFDVPSLFDLCDVTFATRQPPEPHCCPGLTPLYTSPHYTPYLTLPYFFLIQLDFVYPSGNIHTREHPHPRASTTESINNRERAGMEGFTRIMQDGERQRALAPRPKASADHAVKTASRFGTKAIAADKATPATNSVPAAKATPAKKAWPLFKRRVFARKMDKRKHNEGTGTAEQNEAPMTPEQKEAPVTPERQTSAGNRLHGHVDDGVTEADEINELPTQKSIKQHKARPISWRAKEHSALPEECTFDTPVVGIARRGRYRHPLSITPSLATSIASDMESEIGSLHRSPSIISEHATAVQLTRVAPTEVAVHRHPRGQSNEEGHETVPVKENEFEISITAVSDAVSEVSERAETRGTVLVDDTAFELVRPEGLYYIAPPQHPAESFDRRTQARATPRLLTIALPDRNRIYEYLVVAEHDVVVGMQSEDG